MANPFKSPWTGALVTLVATVVNAISFVGPPPVADDAAIAFSAERWHWILFFWAAALVGAIQAFWALHRAKTHAEATVANVRQRRAIANALSALKKEGLHKIRNEYESNPNQLQIYLERERNWSERVKAVMAAQRCETAEIDSIIDITNSEIGEPPPGLIMVLRVIG